MTADEVVPRWIEFSSLRNIYQGEMFDGFDEENAFEFSPTKAS